MKISGNPTLIKNCNRLDLFIEGSGYAEIDTGWDAENIRSLYSRLYIIQSGSGRLCFQGEDIALTPGNIYLIPAGTVFDYGSPEHLKKLFFHIRIDLPTGYDLLAENPGVYQLPLAEEKFEELLWLYRQDSFSAALRLKEELNAQVCRFLEEFHLCDRTIPVYSPAIKETMRYIQENLSIQLSLDFLAERQFLSKSKLTKQFREEVGISISQYIDALIFRSAEYQLIYTDYSLKQISESLGFCDQFYFSRRFHARYSETPLSYRKRLKKTLLHNPI